MRYTSLLTLLATITLTTGCGVLADQAIDSIKNKDKVVIYYTNRQVTQRRENICREIADTGNFMPDKVGGYVSVFQSADESSCAILKHTEGENCTVYGSESMANACVYGYDTK
jgi:hypothetical protein